MWVLCLARVWLSFTRNVRAPTPISLRTKLVMVADIGLVVLPPLPLVLHLHVHPLLLLLLFLLAMLLKELRSRRWLRARFTRSADRLRILVLLMLRVMLLVMFVLLLAVLVVMQDLVLIPLLKLVLAVAPSSRCSNDIG